MTIFLSCVSAQFRRCRETLRSDLAAIGCTVRVQEDFQTGAGSLLEQLEAYVEGANRVIALVGDAYGATAPGPHVSEPRSYTQWEYFLALGERLSAARAEPKDLYVYIASDRYLQAHPVGQSDEEAGRQRAFVTEIKASGKHRAPFDTVDQLRAQVLRDGWQIDRPPPPAIDAATRDALASLRAHVESTDATHPLPTETLQVVIRHPPRTPDERHLHRIAAWSHPRYTLDKRFTRLTMLLDRGPGGDGPRWQAEPRSFEDLRDVVAAAGDAAPVLVLLGPPGSGKSTLLRRLELDVATTAIRDAPADGQWTFFVGLGSYRGASDAAPPPEPEAWLDAQWTRDVPALPAFDRVLQSGRLLLLLDAVNEMPHASRDDYLARVERWRDLAADLARSPAPRPRRSTPSPASPGLRGGRRTSSRRGSRPSTTRCPRPSRPAGKKRSRWPPPCLPRPRHSSTVSPPATSRSPDAAPPCRTSTSPRTGATRSPRRSSPAAARPRRTSAPASPPRGRWPRSATRASSAGGARTTASGSGGVCLPHP